MGHNNGGRDHGGHGGGGGYCHNSDRDDQSYHGQSKSHGPNKDGNQGNRSKSQDKRTKLLQFNQYDPTQPGPTYSTIVDHLAQWCQSNYDYGYNISKSIVNLKLLDMNNYLLVCIISHATEAAAAKMEQDSFDILYQEEICQWMDHKNKYVDNLKRSIL